jgi:hypothetical protein
MIIYRSLFPDFFFFIESRKFYFISHINTFMNINNGLWCQKNKIMPKCETVRFKNLLEPKEIIILHIIL